MKNVDYKMDRFCVIYLIFTRITVLSVDMKEASDLKGSTILWILKTEEATYLTKIYSEKYLILTRISVLAVSRKGGIECHWPI